MGAGYGKRSAQRTAYCNGYGSQAGGYLRRYQTYVAVRDRFTAKDRTDLRCAAGAVRKYDDLQRRICSCTSDDELPDVLVTARKPYDKQYCVLFLQLVAEDAEEVVACSP